MADLAASKSTDELLLLTTTAGTAGVGAGAGAAPGSTTTTTTDCAFLNLPTSVHAGILEFLTVSERMRIAVVCKRLLSALRVRSLWHVIDLSQDGYNIRDHNVACLLQFVAGLFSGSSVRGSSYNPSHNAHVVALQDGVKQLFLDCCIELTDKSFHVIAETCPQLERLRLRGTMGFRVSNVSDNAVAAVARSCAKLQHLTLSGVRSLSDDGIQQLCSLPEAQASLRKLSLDGNVRLSDAIVPSLLQLRNLNSISLIGCRQLSDGALLQLLCSDRQPYRLQKLSLAGIFQLTPATVSTIVATHGATLTELDLSSCRLMDDSALLAIARHCSQLRTVLLNNCSRITDTGVVPLSVGCKQLETIEFAGARLTDLSMALLGRWRPLVDLELYNVKQLTDAGLEVLGSQCLTALRKLRIGGREDNPLIGRSGVVAVTSQAPRLQILSVCGCSGVTNSVVRQVLESCPQLRELDVRRTKACAPLLGALLVDQPGLRTVLLDKGMLTAENKARLKVVHPSLQLFEDD